MTDPNWAIPDGPGEKRETVDFEVKPMARKLAYYLPLGRGSCGGCGQPIVYNMTVEWVEHEEPNPDCPRPWVRVPMTPEQEQAIRAAGEAAEAAARAQWSRHAWMLENVSDPILRALIEAHGPVGSTLWSDCEACPAPPSEYSGDPEPTAWPCSVWSFISDRMEGS